MGERVPVEVGQRRIAPSGVVTTVTRIYEPGMIVYVEPYRGLGAFVYDGCLGIEEVESWPLIPPPEKP